MDKSEIEETMIDGEFRVFKIKSCTVRLLIDVLRKINPDKKVLIDVYAAGLLNEVRIDEEKEGEIWISGGF